MRSYRAQDVRKKVMHDFDEANLLAEIMIQLTRRKLKEKLQYMEAIKHRSKALCVGRT